MNHFIIKRPIVTEKSHDLNSLGQYVFEVAKNASSAEIKKAVNNIYHVDALSVRIINIPAKQGRYGRIKTQKKPAFKKAVVTLKQGQSIEIMPK